MTSYVFEPAKIRDRHLDGTYQDNIYHSITCNAGHTHLSFEEIRLARYYALHPPAPKQNTTDNFLMPNPNFSRKQSPIVGHSLFGRSPFSKEVLSTPSLNSVSRERSLSSSTSRSNLQFTPPPSTSSPTTAQRTPFSEDMAALPCYPATEPRTRFDNISRPQASSLPSVPPDVFILVEGEPNAQFQSITAWRDYAHLSFEEMRFAFYESRKPKMQLPCTTCAAINQEAQKQAIANGQSKSSSGPPTVVDEKNPWPLQWKAQLWGTMPERAASQYKGDVSKFHFVSGFSKLQQGDGLRTTVLEETNDDHGEQATADCDALSVM